MLAELSADCGGFEGNAQTLRLLTRLEAKTFDAEGRSVGLNLTRATLDACTKYPWPRSAADDPHGVHADGTPRVVVKFGVYDDDRPVFDWLRDGVEGRRQLPGGAGDGPRRRRRLLRPRRRGRHRRRPARPHPPRPRRPLGDRAAWYLPGVDDAALDSALADLRAIGSWPQTPYDGSRRSLAAIKNLTSDLIGRFCGSVQQATFARRAAGRRCATGPTWSSPSSTGVEIGVLKGIAAHYVMQADDRVALMKRQRELVAELVELLLGPRRRRPRPGLRRRLGGGRRRRSAAAGGHRPGGVVDRRQCGHPARRAAQSLIRAGRPAGRGCPAAPRCRG